MKSTLVSALVAGLFIGSAALAQSSPASAPVPDRTAKMQQHFDSHFAKSDKNGDGYIDRDEAAGNKRLSKHFDEVDSNKDGKISKDELKAHFASWHAKRRAQYEAQFKAADKDGDGALSKDEAQSANMAPLVKNFDAIDANKDGKVSKDELKAHFASSHAKRRGKFGAKFKAADKDSDGALSKDEAQSANMAPIVQNFDAIDADKDGKVTSQELHTFMISQHKARARAQ